MTRYRNNGGVRKPSILHFRTSFPKQIPTPSVTQAQTCSAWIQQNQASQHTCHENHRVVVKHWISSVCTMTMCVICLISSKLWRQRVHHCSEQNFCQASSVSKTFEHYKGGPHMRSLISIHFPAPEMEPESAHVVSAVFVP